MDIKIALAGNPNCGKTTLFNDLTGSAQYVGNWPGVTVEKKEGRLKNHKEVVIQDLPGVYSLSPYTLEEVVAREYLVHEKPDAVINILDGTNIERNLYLTTQLLELGIPMVIAVNMIDIVRKNGDIIRLQKLAESFHCEVMEISALKGEGSMRAAVRAAELAVQKRPVNPPHVFEGSVEHCLAHIEEVIEDKVDASRLRWYAIKLFERDQKVAEELKLPRELALRIEENIKECEAEMDDDAESIITNQRYAFISRAVSLAVTKKHQGLKMSPSDRIDRVVTNRFLALPIFALVMIGVYYLSISTVGKIVTDFTNETLFGEWILPFAETTLTGWNVAPWLTGLVSEGIVGGVGSVLGFVPQMLVLFFLLAVLEDVGYMARVAFIMDRVFRKFGLSGKSFIPMLIGSGCSVPGIMASRTIENDRDRKMTIMTTSFIPCGAKMPIVGLIAGALFANAWWVAPAAYFLGVAAIIVSGILLKKTRMFAGDPAPFVMELPSYHVPSGTNVLRSTWERGWSFIKRAGTLILLASIVIWFLKSLGFVEGSLTMVEDMNDSILALVGGFLAPLFAPLGFGNWQSSVATVMGLVAKEEVVNVFGVLYGVTGDALQMVEEHSFAGLAPIAVHFTQLSALSFLSFNLLCAPCFAAIGAMKREMNNGKWTAFAVLYLTVFAYGVSLILYQLGLLFQGSGFGLWSGVAVLLLAGLIYLVLRKNPHQSLKDGGKRHA